ncbi:MAG: hypothetical protein PF961_01075 [Planctomycetota bacterium]|nr:hypothetical protein [Planctomycetota bacterium]
MAVNLFLLCFVTAGILAAFASSIHGGVRIAAMVLGSLAFVIGILLHSWRDLISLILPSSGAKWDATYMGDEDPPPDQPSPKE